MNPTRRSVLGRLTASLSVPGSALPEFKTDTAGSKENQPRVMPHSSRVKVVGVGARTYSALATSQLAEQYQIIYLLDDRYADDNSIVGPSDVRRLRDFLDHSDLVAIIYDLKDERVAEHCTLPVEISNYCHHTLSVSYSLPTTRTDRVDATVDRLQRYRHFHLVGTENDDVPGRFNSLIGCFSALLSDGGLGSCFDEFVWRKSGRLVFEEQPLAADGIEDVVSDLCGRWQEQIATEPSFENHEVEWVWAVAKLGNSNSYSLGMLEEMGSALEQGTLAGNHELGVHAGVVEDGSHQDMAYLVGMLAD